MSLPPSDDSDSHRQAHASAAALVYIARFVSPPPSFTPSNRGVTNTRELLRFFRFALQSGARELMKDERVAECLRRIIPNKPHVEILHSPSRQRASYVNLKVCSSLWMCPVCAARISEERRRELQAAMAVPDYHHALMTLTLRHTAQDSLEAVLEALRAAARKMQQGKGWESFRKSSGLVGMVTALEVTHGQNGWHPHLHMLMFFDQAPDLDKIREPLRKRWRQALFVQRRDASWQHGLDLVSGEAAADYVAKFGEGEEATESFWTAAHELTKAASKLGTKGGRTPTQLLADYTLKDDRKAGKLWQEYASAFKGKKQLRWSNGLRKRLALAVEQPDEAIAKAQEDDSRVLAILSKDEWRMIVNHNLRAQLLAVADTGDLEAVHAFLWDLFEA